MKKIIFLAFSFSIISILLINDPVKAASWTCYYDNEGSNFCSATVLDFPSTGSYGSAAECSTFCGF
jgi:hypothetical protein